MIFRSGPARVRTRETAWLLGSRAFSWAMPGQLSDASYLRRPEPDIQPHHTYFVLPPLLLTTLVWLPVATVFTGGRALAGAFRHFGPNAVLLTLASIWTVLGLLVAARLWLD